jgi:23S rRNA-/tRNA-specific pseudouridylate synthase
MSEPTVRWVVASEAERTLGSVAAELGPSGPEALADGRVFVDGRRTLEPNLTVRPGSVIEVHRARSAEGEAVVLAERAGFVFVDKPPGMATEPDHAGVEASLLARVARQLDVPRGELHALSRLDVGVSGVVTLARSAEAREQARALRERGAWQRRYVALTSGAPEPPRGTWTQALARPRSGRSGPRGERDAATRYAHVGTAGPAFIPARTGNLQVRPALVALGPITGRTHQLRLHAAHAGVPLLGDATYGGPGRLVLAGGAVRPLERVALHAAWVELELAGERLRVVAAPPADLLALWSELSGAASSWAEALQATL